MHKIFYVDIFYNSHTVKKELKKENVVVLFCEKQCNALRTIMNGEQYDSKPRIQS